MPSKITTFWVTGTPEFPFDMLRYDQCWPADSEGAAAMSPHNRGRHTIEMRSINESAPTVGRWSSFLWRADVVRPTEDGKVPF